MLYPYTFNILFFYIKNSILKNKVVIKVKIENFLVFAHLKSISEMMLISL